MSGHTPGPWGARPTDPSEAVDFWWLVSRDNRDIGAINGSATDPVAQANARLIAAAPDLLEALVGLLAVTDYIDKPTGKIGRAKRDAARAAISKAKTGELAA